MCGHCIDTSQFEFLSSGICEGDIGFNANVFACFKNINLPQMQWYQMLTCRAPKTGKNIYVVFGFAEGHVEANDGFL